MSIKEFFDLKKTTFFQLFCYPPLSLERFAFYLFILCFKSENHKGCTRVTRKIKNNDEILKFFQYEMQNNQIKYTPSNNHFNYNEFEKQYNNNTIEGIYKKYSNNLWLSRMIYFVISLIFIVTVLGCSIYINNYSFTPSIAIVIVILELLPSTGYFKSLFYFRKINKIYNLLERGSKENNLMIDYEKLQINQKVGDYELASQIHESKSIAKQDKANLGSIKRTISFISQEKDLDQQVEIIKNNIIKLPIEKLEIEMGVPKEFKDFLLSFIKIERDYNDIVKYFKPILKCLFDKFIENKQYNTLLNIFYFILTDNSLKYKSLKYKELTLDIYTPYIKEIFTNVKSYKNIAHIISKLDENLDNLEENIRNNKYDKEKCKTLFGIKNDLNKIKTKFLSLIPLSIYSKMLSVNDDYEIKIIK